jgi:hypothetical protein
MKILPGTKVLSRKVVFNGCVPEEASSMPRCLSMAKVYPIPKVFSSGE